MCRSWSSTTSTTPWEKVSGVWTRRCSSLTGSRRMLLCTASTAPAPTVSTTWSLRNRGGGNLHCNWTVWIVPNQRKERINKGSNLIIEIIDKSNDFRISKKIMLIISVWKWVLSTAPSLLEDQKLNSMFVVNKYIDKICKYFLGDSNFTLKCLHNPG